MKAENTTRIQFDSLSVNEAYARGAAAAFLARYDPTVPQLADLKTAVSEAVTNCIVHAYPDRVGPITMTVSVYPGRVVRIVIADKGVGIPDIPRLRAGCAAWIASVMFSTLSPSSSAS
jgi:stage II sporulation protein AB (anti-sigma F factor)